MTGFLKEVGGLTLFYGRVIRTLLTTSGNITPVFGQITQVYFRSLGTVIASGIFVGAILALQFNLVLSQYDAQTLLGGLTTSACVREVGPLIISFLLAGKIGAYTAAELGTMRVTEQVDAIECLGTDSVQYLILPRFLAIVSGSVLLLVVGLLVSTVGALAVAHWLCGINPLQYLVSIPRFAGPGVFFAGLFKSFVYGVIVAGVACYKGYTASGGARGVGRAVTQAAIYTNLLIVIANFVTSSFLDSLREILKSLSGVSG